MKEIRTVPAQLMFPQSWFYGPIADGLGSRLYDNGDVTEQTVLEQPQFWYQHFLQRLAGTLYWAHFDLQGNRYFPNPRAVNRLQAVSGMASDASGGRRECDKGSGSCPCYSGHHPQLEDKVCIPNALVDANSSGAVEAAANEPKERG